MSLAGLSAERLLELGGLKRHCSEKLRCVAHGLALPCDLCDLEGVSARGVVCESCGHYFDQGLLVTDGRSCQSTAEFARSGKIAFESEASAALRRLEAEAQRREQAEREAAEQARLARLRAEQERRRREEAERAERERRAREREEAETREREEREAWERLAREREAAEEHERQLRQRLELEERAERERVEEEARGRRRSVISLWASALSAALGASLIWSMPFLNPPKTTAYLVGFVVFTLLAWAVSVAPLFGNERPPAMRVLAPAAWVCTAFAWPALTGLMLCLLVAKAAFTLEFAGAIVLVGLVCVPVAVVTCLYVGAALSMRPPWSKEIGSEFRGMRSPWVWLGLTLTILINVILVRGWMNDFDGWFASQAVQSASGGPAVVQDPARTPATVTVSQSSQPVLQPVPPPEGPVTDTTGALPADEVVYLAARLETLAIAGVATRVLLVNSTAGEDIASFARRVGNAWNEPSAATRSDLLVVVAVADRHVRLEITRAFNERVTDAEASRLISTGFVPVAKRSGIAAGLRALVDQIERTTAAQEMAFVSKEDLRVKTLAALEAMAKAVATWDGSQQRLSPTAEAALDSALARLESMPRPARGDRKTARQLHANGIVLLSQEGLASLAVEKLRLAHEADPLDVQVLNDLAFAEQRAGEHRAAIDHLLQTLRLAPTRTSAWVNLAESLPHTAPSPDDARQLATSMYVVGYWFSPDRAKTMELLRAKSTGSDVRDEVRDGALAALQYLQRREEVASTSTGAGTGAGASRGQ
jgi:hypothetical protein